MSDAETPAVPEGPPSGADQLDEAVLATLFAQSAVGLVVLDPRLRLVRANSLVEGAETGEFIGRRFTEVFRLDDPDGAEQIMNRVLAGEGPIRDHLVRGRLRQVPGDREFLVSAYRIDGSRIGLGGSGGGPDGSGGGPADPSALGLLAAVVDVTERERARAREAALAA
uniref:PAS domain-containing protein n=2 Tax=Streptomyces griseus group TaxID=629295 RepID=UPI00130296BF